MKKGILLSLISFAALSAAAQEAPPVGAQLEKKITLLPPHQRESLLFSQEAANALGSGRFEYYGGGVQYKHYGETRWRVQHLFDLYFLSQRSLVGHFSFKNNTNESIPFSFKDEREQFEKTRVKNGRWATPEKVLSWYSLSFGDKYVSVPLVAIMTVVMAAAGGVFGGLGARDGLRSFRNTPLTIGGMGVLGLLGAVLGGALPALGLHYMLRIFRRCKKLHKELMPKITAADGSVRYLERDKLIVLRPGEHFEQYVVWLPSGY